MGLNFPCELCHFGKAAHDFWMTSDARMFLCDTCKTVFGEDLKDIYGFTPIGGGMGMDAGGIYVIAVTGLASPAGTIIQITASSSVPVEIIKARFSETASTTSTKVPVRLITWGAAATSMNSATVTKVNGGQASSTVTGKYWKTGQSEGSTEVDFDVDASNFLQPWIQADQPDFRILVAPSGIAALYAPSAPAGTYAALLGWREGT
jgi:hypothetical protein